MADDDLTAELERLHAIEQAATDGPWELEYESCECGGDYPCRHGKWPYAIKTPRSHTERPPGEEPRWFDFIHSEMPELAEADLEFIAEARTAMPLLVGAILNVLKLHQPGRIVVFGATCERHEAHRHFSIDRREADAVRACPDCTATVYVSCTGCGNGVSVDACPVREAITSALTGKEAGDAGT